MTNGKKKGDILSLRVAFVDKSGGKSRPVVIDKSSGSQLEVFRITSKYKDKSKFIKQQYCEITDWKEAGLNKPSWIDIGSTVTVNTGQIDYKEIGALSSVDSQRLAKFIDGFTTNRGKTLLRSNVHQKVSRAYDKVHHDLDLPANLGIKSRTIQAVVDAQMNACMNDYLQLLRDSEASLSTEILQFTREYVQENFDDSFLYVKVADKVNIEQLMLEHSDKLVSILTVVAPYKNAPRAYWGQQVAKVKSFKELYGYVESEDLETFVLNYCPDWKETRQ